MSEYDTLGVGQLPGRKRPALYECSGGRITVLAYFRSTAEMERYLAWNPSFRSIPPQHVKARVREASEQGDTT